MLASSWTINLIILSLTFWIVLYFFVTRKFNYWKNRKAPYLSPIPFFGNALDVFVLRKNIGELCRDIYKSTTKPFIGFFICDEPYLLVRDPELIKTILIKDFPIFNDRSITENKKDDPMGAHLLFILKNPDWREMRRKISPVFTTAKIKAMFKLIQETGSEMIEHLKTEVDKNSTIEVREVMAKYTTDTITSTAFGIRANSFKNENAEFRKVSRRILNWSILERAISTSFYFLAPNLVKLFKLKFIDTESATFLRKAFWKTMTEREQSKIPRNDLIDILIEIKNHEEADDPYKFEGDKVLAQATQFFLGGYETTSTTICFMLYELALHEDIQTKLREEIFKVRRKYGEISYDSLKDMTYLDMCIKEGMRKYPILPFLDRRCNFDYKIPGTNIVLEKGISVFISILGSHYNSEYFPDPEKYDPRRFTEENEASRPPFIYMPFGEGPRNCIGARFAKASMKSSLALILSTFEIEVSDQTQHPIKIDPKGFLTAPASNLFLKFKRYNL